jgi:hypothetical protein
MNNYIKSRPLQSKQFSALFSSMEPAHTQLLLHAEMWWLSRGRVLTMFYELKGRAYDYFHV